MREIHGGGGGVKIVRVHSLAPHRQIYFHMVYIKALWVGYILYILLLCVHFKLFPHEQTRINEISIYTSNYVKPEHSFDTQFFQELLHWEGSNFYEFSF